MKWWHWLLAGGGLTLAVGAALWLWSRGRRTEAEDVLYRAELEARKARLQKLSDATLENVGKANDVAKSIAKRKHELEQEFMNEDMTVEEIRERFRRIGYGVR